MFTPLPVQVEFKRIITNILNARHIKKQEEWGKEGMTMQDQAASSGPFITGGYTSSFDGRNGGANRTQGGTGIMKQ